MIMGFHAFWCVQMGRWWIEAGASYENYAASACGAHTQIFTFKEEVKSKVDFVIDFSLFKPFSLFLEIKTQQNLLFTFPNSTVSQHLNLSTKNNSEK